MLRVPGVLPGTAHAEKTDLPYPDPPPFKVTLTLDQDEANFLRTVLQHIGGDAYNSPRRHAAAITNALYEARVPVGSLGFLVRKDSREGTIWFNNYTYDG